MPSSWGNPWILLGLDPRRGPGVKNLPCCAGDVGSTPGRGTKILCATGHEAHAPALLSLRAATKERPVCRNQTQRSYMPQGTKLMRQHYWACGPQQEACVPKPNPTQAETDTALKIQWEPIRAYRTARGALLHVMRQPGWGWALGENR